VPDAVSRRELLRAGGAGAAGLALLGARGVGAQAPARMNVVVVVMDSLRADHIYGSRARTASWDKVGRQGLRFLNAYPEGMPTIPARRAIMSGKRTFPFRGWRPRWHDLPAQPGWEPVGSDGEMWTATLREAGWTTGYVTDNPHLLLPVHRRFRAKFDRVELVQGQVPVQRRPPHLPSRRELNHYVPKALRGTIHERRMANYLALNPPGRDEKDYNAAKVFREAMGWVEWARGRQQPFALVVDSFDAHEPWDAPRRLIDMYGPARVGGGLEPIQPFETPAARTSDIDHGRRLLRRIRQLYAAEVTLVDVWLGHFLDRLENLGLADNTLLVLVSDHGVLLGEHGWVGKRYSEMHQELTHVPLAIRHPAGKAKGRTTGYYASTHDIGPTVLSMLGVDEPRGMNGVDLSPLLSGRSPRQKRGHRTASYNSYVSAGDDRWLLIAGNRREELRLYDRRHDRGEFHNVAHRNPKQVRRLWNLILHEAGGHLPHFPEGGAEG
jgi:arylsulfatase A-like enzyme